MRRTLEEMEKRHEVLSSDVHDAIDENDPDELCAACGWAVDVRSGSDWSPGMLCDNCWVEQGEQAHADRGELIAEVKRLEAANEDLSGMCSRCPFMRYSAE